MDEQDPKLGERLDAALKKLPREVQPPRDLWPEITAKIDARERHARRPSRAVAAAFVGAIAAAAAVALVARGGGGARSQETDAARGVASASHVQVEGSTAPGAVPVLAEEEAYVAAAETLRAELEARRDEEPPAVLAVVDENVRIVDDAIRTVRAALAAHPDDPELHADLDRAYQDKLDVLRAATELPPSAFPTPERDVPR